MITTTPPIGILIDLPFGLLMWTSFVHFLLIIAMNEDSGFLLLRLSRGLNAPIYAVINLIKPAFIISRLLPLYAAGILCIMFCRWRSGLMFGALATCRWNGCFYRLNPIWVYR
jgi:hypothetical protein